MAEPIKIREAKPKATLKQREILQNVITGQIAQLRTEPYNKQDIAVLSSTTAKYANASSDITAKELLKFYSEVINRADMGKQSNYTQQDKQNITLLLDIISGLVLAIKAYEQIVAYNAKLARGQTK